MSTGFQIELRGKKEFLAISISKEIRLALGGGGLLDGGVTSLLPESHDIPDADGLVKRAGHDEILGGVELGAHDVVVVPSEDGDASPGLPVPDPDSLVVRG